MPPTQAHIVPQPRAGTLCVAGCPAWQGRRRHQCCHYSGRPWRVRSTWPFRGENALHQCIPEPCCRLVHRVGSRGRGGLAAGCRGFCPYTLAPLLVQAYLCVTKDPGAPITDLEVSIPSLDEHPPTECALALLQLRTATVSLTHTHTSGCVHSFLSISQSVLGFDCVLQPGSGSKALRLHVRKDVRFDRPPRRALALACRSLTRVFPRVPCPAEPHQRLPSAAAVTIAYRRQRQHQCRGEPGQAVEDAGAPSQCERRAGRPQGRERHRALPVHHGLEHVAPAGTQPAGSGCTAATATTRQQRQGATASDSHAWAVGGDWVQHGGVPKHAAAVHIRGEAQPHHHRGIAAPGLAQRRRRGQRGGFPAFHPDRRGDRARDGQ